MSRAHASLFATITVFTLVLAHAALPPPENPIDVVLPDADYDPMTTRPNEEGDAGARSYLRYCAGCHGVEGDGKGPAAALLDPKPRDFTLGVYKFTSSVQGHEALNEDILRTITRGLDGTSMPAWRFLPEHERRSLVRYVKGFYEDWDDVAPPVAIPTHELPYDLEDWVDLEDAIREGETVYHQTTTCWTCHAGYMDVKAVEQLIERSPGADYAVSVAKPDVWKAVIKPPDFRRDTLKSVRTLDDLYLVIAAGVPGTAMPAWTNLSGEQLWSLTLYVDSLRPDSIARRRIERLKKAEAAEETEEEEN